MCATRLHHIWWYGVVSSSRLLKIIGLFCKTALQKRRYSAKSLLIAATPYCGGPLRAHTHTHTHTHTLQLQSPTNTQTHTLAHSQTHDNTHSGICTHAHVCLNTQRIYAHYLILACIHSEKKKDILSHSLLHLHCLSCAPSMCCSVLQCVAVCCRVLPCVAVCCRVLQVVL